MNTRYVTHSELKDMMDPKNGLLWSPWFRIIAENWLGTWWDDIDGVLMDGKHIDTKTVHKIL